jgi:hypothetical protein
MSIDLKLNFNQEVWQANFLDSMEMNPGKEKSKKEIFYSEEESPTLMEIMPREEFSDFIHFQELDTVQFQKALSAHHIKQVTSVALQLFQDQIKVFNDLKHVCIAYTGSDGREEKLSPFSSPIELMFIVKRKEDLESETLEKVQEFITQHPTLFYNKIEVKCLEDDSLICFNRNWDWKGKKDNRPFPTRPLDAHYLIGDSSILAAYKMQFYQELQDPKNAKLLKRFKKDAVQPTQSLLKRTLDQSTLSDIDLGNSVAFYDGERIKGPKYPFLRAVQYKLGLHICSQIQKKKMSLEDFCAMPYSTVERIQWLAANKFLNMTKTQVEAFQKSYTSSLIWFGIVQKNYEVHGKSQTQLPSEDLQVVAKTIASICQDKKIFA